MTVSKIASPGTPTVFCGGINVRDILVQREREMHESPSLAEFVERRTRLDLLIHAGANTLGCCMHLW